MDTFNWGYWSIHNPHFRMRGGDANNSTTINEPNTSVSIGDGGSGSGLVVCHLHDTPQMIQDLYLDLYEKCNVMFLYCTGSRKDALAR